MTTSSTHPAPDAGENALELGPDLPMSVFTSTEPWHPERIGALALYCSDGRWGEAFDDFCHKCLHIPRYDRWAVPGGPAWLATPAEGGGLAQAASEQLDFLVKVHGLERIVLITHHGCAAYTGRSGRPAGECLAEQISDLRIAAEALRKRYATMQVEGYVAMRRGRSLSFHQVAV